MKKHANAIKRGLRHPTTGLIWRRLKGRKRYIVIAAILLFLFVIFTDQVKAFIILAVFGIVSSTVTVYKRVVRMPPVFELVSLTTVMVTIFYGPVVGVIYTIVVNLASEVMSGYPDVMTLTYIPSRTIQALFVWFAFAHGSMGIVSLGIWSNVIFNMVQQPIFMFLTDAEQRLKALYFVILNIPINILIFKTIGEPLYRLLEAIV